jgi:hypothetical protein
MLILVTPVIYPRIFHGFETLWKIYHPNQAYPESFTFDNVDDFFNFDGIEHKMGFMKAETVEEFVIDPDIITASMMDYVNLHDANELFDDFLFEEIYMEDNILP